MLAELGRILPLYTRTKSLFNFHTEPIGVFGLWIFIISLECIVKYIYNILGIVLFSASLGLCNVTEFGSLSVNINTAESLVLFRETLHRHSYISFKIY